MECGEDESHFLIMKVLTEPIVLALVPKEEGLKISGFLQSVFALSCSPQHIFRFQEKTSSAVYKCALDGGQTVVVKQSFFVNDSSALEKAYEVSEALRTRGVPLPEVFRSKGGGFVGRSGEVQLVVQAFIGGEHFCAKPEEFVASGAALGKLHAAGAQYLAEHPQERERIQKMIPVEKSYEESRDQYAGTLRTAFLAEHECTVPKVCEAFRVHVGALEVVMEQIDGSGVNASERLSGVLHNDFHTNNALFAENGTLTTFLDIDQVGIGPFVWDVGNTLASFFSNAVTQGTVEEFPRNAAAFLRAYHREHPLSLEEYRLLAVASQRWDMMRILRSLTRHHFENNRLPGLLPKIADRLIPRAIQLPSYWSFLTTEWLRTEIIS